MKKKKKQLCKANAAPIGAYRGAGDGSPAEVKGEEPLRGRGQSPGGLGQSPRRSAAELKTYSA